jgi:exosome complex component RRP41
MAPFSTSERRKRRPGDRKSLEIAMAVQQTFEAVVMTHLYPRSQIDIFIQVIQVDGGATLATGVVCVESCTQCMFACVPVHACVGACVRRSTESFTASRVPCWAQTRCAQA